MADPEIKLFLAFSAKMEDNKNKWRNWQEIIFHCCI